MNFEPFKRSVSMNPRIFRMLETHARVDEALRQEQSRPGADSLRVRELKKVKLRIKDLIHRLLTRRLSRAVHG
jgi:uncharacterized protein